LRAADQNARNRAPAQAAPPAAPQLVIDREKARRSASAAGSSSGLTAICARVLVAQDWRHSAKTRRLIEELKRVRDEDPTVKTVIFSQWTMVRTRTTAPVCSSLKQQRPRSQMLDLLETPLRREGFLCVRLDGWVAFVLCSGIGCADKSPVPVHPRRSEGAQKERERALATFANDPNYPVMLISLKAGEACLAGCVAGWPFCTVPRRRRPSQAVWA
jgi:SNF2 family DNA or RNA helicase